MTILSMTGFARAGGASAERSWTWEARSVNGRGLDVRCRLPTGYDHLEASARAAVAKRATRGNVSLTLTMTEAAGTGRFIVNRELLDRLVTLARELERDTGLPPPRLDGLLAVRGVVETGVATTADEAARAAHEAEVMASLDEALRQLDVARAQEGAKLAEALSRHLDQIAEQTRAARETAVVQPAAIRTRLETQLRELLGAETPLPAERLAQEIALLAARADVREELDRLDAHIEAARALLAAGGPIGRKLDFLAQEFNREANTLCSKSADIELTRIGLALKAAVDQLREQAQNIE